MADRNKRKSTRLQHEINYVLEVFRDSVHYWSHLTLTCLRCIVLVDL